jgi:4-amino-4-deoxy-L-arabinose transferase-like glycosyltransferase
MNEEIIAEAQLPERPVTVGITAGASTPNRVIGEVIERMARCRGEILSALASGSSVFRLPEMPSYYIFTARLIRFFSLRDRSLLIHSDAIFDRSRRTGLGCEHSLNQAGGRYFLSLALVLCGIFFFYRLGSVALIGPDEPRYAQVAREMLRRGDLITPTIGGRPWFEKPALLYWLMMINMRVFGVNEWAARLPSALMATVAVWAVYYTGRRIIGPRFGFLSALVVITNVLFVSFAHGATTDMLLAVMIALGLCCFFLFDAESGERTSRWLLAASACFGLAMLAKGLIGLLLPAGIIGGYLALTRRWGKLRPTRLLLGVLLVLAIASTWYGPVIARHGWAFIDEFFISHHFERFATSKFHHPGPVYYFIPVILGGLFPWTAFLVSAFARLRWSQLQADDPRLRLRWFCAVWIVVPLVFFSFSSSKLPGYILPVVPAAAFLVAAELHRLVEAGADRASRLSLSITPALMMAIGVAAVIYARREIQAHAVGSILILALVGLTAAALLYFSLVEKFKVAIASLVIGCAVGVLLVSHFYLPAIADKESFRSLAQVALRQMRPGERMVGYYYFHHTFTFYTDARSFYDEKGNVIIATSPGELIDRAGSAGSVLCLTRRYILEILKKDARWRVQLIGQQHDIVLARVMTGRSP